MNIFNKQLVNPEILDGIKNRSEKILLDSYFCIAILVEPTASTNYELRLIEGYHSKLVFKFIQLVELGLFQTLPSN